MKLDYNFGIYLETTMISERALRTGIKQTPYLKSYKINTGMHLFTVDVRSASKKFSFLETSLVYD